MLAAIPEILTRLVGWLARRPAYMFLTADPQRLSAEAPDRFARVWVGLLALSLAWSLASVGIWAGAWKLFGEPLGRLMPAVAVTGVAMLWPYRRAAAATAELISGPDSTARSIASAVMVVLLMAALLSLRTDYYRLDASLPAVVAWLRPWVKPYRALILMPLWGAWAMMVMVQFHKPGRQSSPAVAAMAGGCGPVATTAVMAMLLACTITYFNFLPWEQLSISAVTVIAAVAGGAILCRLAGGLTRKALLAANLVTQLAFLLACLAMWNLLTW